jgi:tetratricopeptide (TPR) repeat protein
MQESGFVDKSRRVQSKYYDTLDRIDAEEMRYQKIVKLMNRLIDEDPDFLDPYLEIYEIYQYENKDKKARQVLEKAYKRAINLITDKKGDWPSVLLWGFLENRHIIRTILNKALLEWDDRNDAKALELLRKLLKTNPNDNIGAREYILAIRMGFTMAGFEDRFNKGGYYDMEVTTWFEEHAPKFPDEFDWWFEEMKKQGF